MSALRCRLRTVAGGDDDRVRHRGAGALPAAAEWRARDGDGVGDGEGRCGAGGPDRLERRDGGAGDADAVAGVGERAGGRPIADAAALSGLRMLVGGEALPWRPGADADGRWAARWRTCTGRPRRRCGRRRWSCRLQGKRMGMQPDGAAQLRRRLGDRSGTRGFMFWMAVCRLYRVVLLASCTSRVWGWRGGIWVGWSDGGAVRCGPVRRGWEPDVPDRGLGAVAAGRCVGVCGRADAQLKLRGFRIEPGEIEAALCGVAGVAQAAVVARGGPCGSATAGGVRGGVGRALIRRSGASRCGGGAAAGPHGAVCVRCAGRLPLTPNGKSDRRALPAPELRGPAPWRRRARRSRRSCAVCLRRCSVSRVSGWTTTSSSWAATRCWRRV